MNEATEFANRLNLTGDDRKYFFHLLGQQQQRGWLKGARSVLRDVVTNTNSRIESIESSLYASERE